jgi:TubC N-terminal docking domain
MTLVELLAELEARDIRIEGAGDRLRLEAPPGAAPAWLLAALVEHRAALLALPEPETGAAETAPAGLPASGAADAPTGPGEPLRVSVSPRPKQPTGRSGRTPQVVCGAPLPIGPEGRGRIPLDDLVYGDFLARNKLRIVGGTAYPDGRTFRPTLYLAEDDTVTPRWGEGETHLLLSASPPLPINSELGTGAAPPPGVPAGTAQGDDSPEVPRHPGGR